MNFISPEIIETFLPYLLPLACTIAEICVAIQTEIKYFNLFVLICKLA